MAKLKLLPIKDGRDKNRYCGPSVISALTKLTTGEAARLIRLQSPNRKSVKGTHSYEVRRAFDACNIEMRRFPVMSNGRSRRPSLAAWLKQSKKARTPGRGVLLVAGNHGQLVSGRRYTCGRIRDIVSIKDKRVKRRARVSEVYELTSENVTKPDIDVSKPRAKSNPAYYHVRKIIKKYPEFGLSYERESQFHYWVTMSGPLEKLATELEHPLCDEHYCYDIDEIWSRMEDMVLFAKEHYSKVAHL